MSERKPIIAANWKMHKTLGEAVSWVEDFLPRVADVTDVEIVVAPPATALDRVNQSLDGSRVLLAAQNVHPAHHGAYTGEISAEMLADVGCSYIIVGHSERRQLHGETSELVAEKLEALLEKNVLPIVCVGETLEQRDAGQAFDVIGEQIGRASEVIPAERAAEVVVAYEPVWAIGTGRAATPEMAQEMHAFVREQLSKQVGEVASRIRIQYGGSVKPDNVYDLMSQPDIDGALVGGASLDAESFARIVRFEPPA